MLEAGNALEPVVLRAMERAGWEIAPADPHDPKPVSVQIAPNLKATGHPDANGGHAPVRRRGGHRGQDQGAWGLQALADPGGGASHPDSVAHAAYGLRWPRPPSTPTGPSERPATR